MAECEHHYSITCLMGIAERHLTQCSLCRANLLPVEIPRANWPLPVGLFLLDPPHLAGAHNFFNYHQGVVQIPPLSPLALRFVLGTSGKHGHPSPVPLPAPLPSSFPEESLLPDVNGLPAQPSPLPLGTEDEEEDQHLQRQLRLLRQQAQQEILDPTVASSNSPWRPAPSS